jgi:hypothetical protein
MRWAANTDALACELSLPLFAQYREKELAVAGGRSALSQG